MADIGISSGNGLASKSLASDSQNTSSGPVQYMYMYYNISESNNDFDVLHLVTSKQHYILKSIAEHDLMPKPIFDEKEMICFRQPLCTSVLS
jgi:hypothetical protein